MEPIFLHVTGMTCSYVSSRLSATEHLHVLISLLNRGCVNTVENALSGIHGVDSAIVDLSQKVAVIEGSVPERDLIRAINDIGMNQ